MTVAETILYQLGGNQFLTMTGAKCLALPNGLQIDLPRTKKGVNRITIKTAPPTLYAIEYGKVTNRRPPHYKKIGEFEGVYHAQLPSRFSEATGLAPTL